MQTNTTFPLLARLWRDYMRIHLRGYCVAVVFMIVVGGMSALMVRLVEPTLDLAFINKDQNLIYLVAAAFLLCAIIRGIANYGQSVLLYHIGFKIIERIQNQMFQTLQGADLQYFLRTGTSSQISRFTNDVTQLRMGLAKIFLSFGRDCSILLFMCATMFSLNAKMAMVVIVALPVTIIPIIWIGKQIRRLSRKTQNELSNMTAMLDDALKSIRQTIIYNRQDSENARARDIFANVFSLSYRSARYSALSYPIMDTIGGAIMGGVILWGGSLILAGEITIGQFMAFFIAIISAYQPMRSLSKLNASLQESLAAADRVFALLDNQNLRILPKETQPPIKFQRGIISFSNVGFHHEENAEFKIPALEAITLDFPEKSISAIIGPSGSGKSTILNLIARLYAPTSGKIILDEHNIADHDAASVRELIAFMSQDTALFDTSIGENIAFGNKHASKQEILAAASQAGLDGFLDSLPDHIETRVGEMGTRISGGQRQRIALARAIIKQAPILLLDEPTAALDEATETQIWQDLLPIMQQKTTILVTHRLHLLKHCQQAFVINNAKLIKTLDRASLQHNAEYIDLAGFTD